MTGTPIADMITEMLKNCIPIEMIVSAVRSMERASTRHVVEEVAEKRRAWDREYRRRKREHPPDPPDKHPIPPDNADNALSFFREDKKHSEVVSKKERKDRGCKIPPDWIPKQKHYDAGAARGMDRVGIEELADTMRVWCAANANKPVTTKADWDATFTGFIRREPSPTRPAKPLTEYQRQQHEAKGILNDLRNFASGSGQGNGANPGLLPDYSGHGSAAIRGGPDEIIVDLPLTGGRAGR